MEVTRRDALKLGAAAVGSAAGSGAITGFPTIWAQNIKDIMLTHAGPSYAAINAVAIQASKDLGFQIKIQNIETDILGRLLAQPLIQDVVALSGISMRYLGGRDILQPIPKNSYRYWDQTLSIMRSGEYEDGRQIPQQGVTPNKILYYKTADAKEFASVPTDWMSMIPTLFDADTAAQRPDLIGRRLTSWSAFLDSEFKGKVGLSTSPSLAVMDIAMAVEGRGDIRYGDKGNMTKDEIDRTIKLMIDLKRAGQFRAFYTTFDQAVNLMASGETVVQSMIEPAVVSLRARGVNAYYGPLKEGYRGWMFGMGLMKHLTGLRRDCALEYVNWYLSGWQGAFIARQGFYTPVPSTVKQFLSPAEWNYWFEGKPATVTITDPFGKKIDDIGQSRAGGSFAERMSNIGCWNSVMDEDRYLTRRWNELVAS
jgi:putative spermidine/putrescine transport system substrate-binding protein